MAEEKTEKKKMNLGVIIAICAAVAVIACVIVVVVVTGGSKDKANGLVGSWKYGSSSSFVYTFNDDGTCSYAGRNCTYTNNGDSVEILYDGDTASQTYGYRIEDNKTLYIKDSFGSDVVYERQ